MENKVEDISKVEAELAVDLWGKEAQVATFIEEIGEYLQAWNKRKRNKVTEEEYVSEIADVYIMIQQMIHIYREVFDKVYPQKLAKIRTKLEASLLKAVDTNIERILKIESFTLWKAMEDNDKDVGC